MRRHVERGSDCGREAEICRSLNHESRFARGVVLERQVNCGAVGYAGCDKEGGSFRSYLEDHGPHHVVFFMTQQVAMPDILLSEVDVRVGDIGGVAGEAVDHANRCALGRGDILQSNAIGQRPWQVLLDRLEGDDGVLQRTHAARFLSSQVHWDRVAEPRRPSQPG